MGKGGIEGGMEKGMEGLEKCGGEPPGQILRVPPRTA